MKKVLIALALLTVTMSCNKLNSKCEDAKLKTEKELKSYNDWMVTWSADQSTYNYNKMQQAKQNYEQALKAQNNTCK